MDKNDLTGLDRNGFTYKTMSFDPSIFEDSEKLIRIRGEVRKYFSKTKSLNRSNSSYGLKHILERHIGTYVSNGELIYAMHLEGFKIYKSDINCGFNVGKTGINLLSNSNKIENILETSLNYDYSEYLKTKRKYLKYKYHLKLLIDNRFWGEGAVKRLVPSFIAKNIYVSLETVKSWINLLAIEENEIPIEKLKKVSELFNEDYQKLINREQKKI